MSELGESELHGAYLDGIGVGRSERDAEMRLVLVRARVRPLEMEVLEYIESQLWPGDVLLKISYGAESPGRIGGDDD